MLSLGSQPYRTFHFQWESIVESLSLTILCGLKELADVRRKMSDSIDDYLYRLRLIRARCFTQVHEHELVEMSAGVLDFSIRKKSDTQYLRDMGQLADRVRQVERLKAKKARTNMFSKKEKVSYVDANDNGQDIDIELDVVEENEINLVELKPGPLYICKMLKPSMLEQNVFNTTL